MIEIKNISKSFGDKAVLRCLSASFGSGIHGISAPSGAGKTTLLRIVAGLEKPDSGTVSGAGRVSFSFQEARLMPWLGAEKNAAIAEERPGYAKEILKMLGLSDEYDTPARSLSGGMQMRVSLARALAAPFDTLLLDEPFSGLDAESTDMAMSAVRELCGGRCVLLVTHSSRTLAQCDSVFTLG